MTFSKKPWPPNFSSPAYWLCLEKADNLDHGGWRVWRRNWTWSSCWDSELGTLVAGSEVRQNAAITDKVAKERSISVHHSAEPPSSTSRLARASKFLPARLSPSFLPLPSLPPSLLPSSRLHRLSYPSSPPSHPPPFFLPEVIKVKFSY